MGLKHKIATLAGRIGEHFSKGDTYDRAKLHRRLNRIYESPPIAVDPTRPATINVLVPKVHFPSMSAGFFGVFQTAHFLRKCGYHVRLLFFDRFKFEPGELRRAFSGYPGMEHTLDTLDYEYIGERKAPLRVSPGDTCLATVWYSAYLAHSIMQKLGNRPFLYLIQDYEANFYAANAWFALAERTYHLNYHALFSTAALEQFFVSRDVGGLVSRQLKRIHFNNSCACSLPDRDAFFARGANGRKRMFAFYCRPAVDRNMFELGALTLVESVGAGIFDPEQWDFRGIGLGKCTIQLAKDLYLRQMPRMNLKDYLKSISEYDLGLTLMGSPHPSLVPFDLAGSGAVVVTNSFANKNQLYFSGLAPNVICREPHLDALMDGLAEAVARTEDLEARYDAALQMKYPKSWDETWTPEHQSFIASVLG